MQFSSISPGRRRLLVVAMLGDNLKIDTILTGFALPDDAIHAPDERFHLPNFYKGISTSIHFMAEMGKQSVMAGYPFGSFEAAGTFEFPMGGIP